MGRKCAVPHCYTGYRKCKEKASLYKVPDDDFFLNKWQEAIAREDRPITPRDYVCEKHFKEDDIQRTRVIKNVVEVYLRPKLRPDAIPSIFPDLPEFILKMVKKRRKLLPQDLKKTNNSEGTTHDDGDKIETDSINKEAEGNNVKEEPILTESGISETDNNITNNEIEIKSENEESTEKQDQQDEDSDRPRMFKCDECEYETKYPHNLRTHQTKHLTGEEAYIHCEICPDYKTKWELTYRNHMKIKHGIGSQEIFSCNLCDYNTRVKLCLKRHIDRHNKFLPEQKYKCEHPECNYECDSRSLLKIHNLIHNDENEKKAFKCTECHYSTNSKTHILKHIKSAHNTGDDTVVSVSMKNSDKVIEKRRRPNGKTLYRCMKCTFQTHYHSFLLKHLVKHREGESKQNTINISKVWKCSKCPYATFFQHALEAHQEADCERNHTNLDQMEDNSDFERKNNLNDTDEHYNKSDGDHTKICPKQIEISNENDFEENTDNDDDKMDMNIEVDQENFEENSGNHEDDQEYFIENQELPEENQASLDENQEIGKEYTGTTESIQENQKSHNSTETAQHENQENRKENVEDFPIVTVKEEHD